MFLSKTISFNRNILYCKSPSYMNNQQAILDLIGTFCIVNEFYVKCDKDDDKFNRNILYCKQYLNNIMKDKLEKFNRNILYCKPTNNTVQIQFVDNLIGTFCIVNK